MAGLVTMNVEHVLRLVVKSSITLRLLSSRCAASAFFICINNWESHLIVGEATANVFGGKTFWRWRAKTRRQWRKSIRKTFAKKFFFLFRGRIPASAGVEAEVSENKRQWHIGSVAAVGVFVSAVGAVGRRRRPTPPRRRHELCHRVEERENKLVERSSCVCGKPTGD